MESNPHPAAVVLLPVMRAHGIEGSVAVASELAAAAFRWAADRRNWHLSRSYADLAEQLETGAAVRRG